MWSVQFHFTLNILFYLHSTSSLVCYTLIVNIWLIDVIKNTYTRRII